MLIIHIFMCIFSLSIPSAQAFQKEWKETSKVMPERKAQEAQTINENPWYLFNELNEVRENFAGPTKLAKEMIPQELANQGVYVENWEEVKKRYPVSYVMNDNSKVEIFIDINGTFYKFDRFKGKFLGINSSH